MAIIRWKPFNVGQFLSEDFPELRIPRLATSLAADVYEEDNKVMVEMDLAGIDPESLDITVEDNYVHIAGSREESKEEEKKNYYYKEIQRGSFERTIRLPANVKKEKAEATFEDGILQVAIPKIEEKKTIIRVAAKKRPAERIKSVKPKAKTKPKK